MIAPLLALGFAADRLDEPPVRTPAIYRCPAAEAESKFFQPLMSEEGFDAVCVEPKPGLSARSVIHDQRLRTFSAREIDTRANLRWRDATVAFAKGDISPKAWIERTRNLKETVHFLSNPKSPSLRQAIGPDSTRAVFAELVLLSSPGRVCITANDTGATRYLPGPGALENWYLAMRDNLGPMLYLRHDTPSLVVGKPTVLRADPKPGLLVLRYGRGDQALTFFLNNGPAAVRLPKIDWEKVGAARGLTEDTTGLRPTGFFILHGDPETGPGKATRPAPMF